MKMPCLNKGLAFLKEICVNTREIIQNVQWRRTFIYYDILIIFLTFSKIPVKSVLFI